MTIYYKSFSLPVSGELAKFYLRGDTRAASSVETFIHLKNVTAYLNLRTGIYSIKGQFSALAIDQIKKLFAIAKTSLTSFNGISYGAPLQQDLSVLFNLDVSYHSDSIDTFKQPCYVYYTPLNHFKIRYSKGDKFALAVWEEESVASGYFLDIHDWHDDFYISSLRFLTILENPIWDETRKSLKAKVNIKELHNATNTI